MVARTVETMGLTHVGIGSDLCQDQPDSVVEWMRTGRWSKQVDFGEGTPDNAGFPAQPEWFRDNRDFANLQSGLAQAGFTAPEVAAILGGNWLDFFRRSLEPAVQD